MSTPTATGQAYVGCRVRWCGGDLLVPAKQCRPGALVATKAIEIQPGVWEISDGVCITSGDEGVVSRFLGSDLLGDAFEILFDHGGRFALSLPQPHAVTILD